MYEKVSRILSTAQWGLGESKRRFEMKTKVVLCLFMCVLGMIVNTNAFSGHARNYAQARIRIKVVDQDGLVVPEAKIWGGFTCGLGIDDYILVDGMTDKYGMFTAEGRCNDFLRFDVLKEGYYHSEMKINFWESKTEPIVVDGKWQPYGELRTVVLRKIVNPIPMTIPKAHYCEKVPHGQWHGFDIVCGDWMPPYGKGEHEDVIMRHNIEAVNNMNNFRTTLEVCFTNSPYAGVYRKMKDKQSDFNVEYHANTNAVYTKELSFVYEKRPHKPTIDTRVGADEYLVFRIRTKEDAEGRLISAQYGKILGPWTFFDAVSSAGIYVNPTPNDTNLEDEEGVRRARRSYKQFLEREERRKRNANR